MTDPRFHEWRKKLTKKQLKHLKQMKIHNFEQMKNIFEFQKELRKKFPKIEPCWDCREIAQILGFEI